MTTHCPECGAPLVDELTCWEQLGAVLAWEWQDPELLAVHFLTVASYNLQHPAQFTDEAIDGLRTVFIAHLDEEISIRKVRRRISQGAEGKQRVLKKDADRQPPVKCSWPMTIANVYIPDQPQGAADRVKAWAAAIRGQI